MIANSLGAVVPERLFAGDLKGEDVGSLAVVGLEVEAGEDTVFERLAWLVERGLSDGVVLGKEVELNVVTNLGDNVLGLEVQTLVRCCRAGEDAVDDARAALADGACGGEADDSGRSGKDGGEGNHFE